MQAKEYLQYIVEKIHSTVFATVGAEMAAFLYAGRFYGYESQ